ncbi:hypothetical protein MKX01_020268 [Papaver californicum]|nr:hypothetical protein MKX01_020268 [Papaver californicum]
MHAKETLLRNASAFAECLFQSWRDDDHSQPSSSKGNSWFKRYWPKDPKKNSTGSQGSRLETYRSRGEFHKSTKQASILLSFNARILMLYLSRKGAFQFCDASDEEVDTEFRSAFDRERYTSFLNEDYFQWRNSSGYSYYSRSSRNTRSRFENDYETYEDFNDNSNSSASDLASDRLALGLSASGPLKLEDVKNAYSVPLGGIQTVIKVVLRILQRKSLSSVVRHTNLYVIN